MPILIRTGAGNASTRKDTPMNKTLTAIALAAALAASTANAQSFGDYSKPETLSDWYKRNGITSTPAPQVARDEWKMPYSEGCSPDGRSCVYNPHARGPYQPPASAPAVAPPVHDTSLRENQGTKTMCLMFHTTQSAVSVGAPPSQTRDDPAALETCDIKPDEVLWAMDMVMSLSPYSAWVSHYCTPVVPRGFRCDYAGFSLTRR
jgi:hypothetical protein